MDSNSNFQKIAPIGIEDFSEMQLNWYYYVDKTLFIKELLDTLAKVNVFLRPRRFGKTLTLSMLKYFFEDTGDGERNAANRELFCGTRIMREDSRYTARMTSAPVLSLTLKSAKQPTLSAAMFELKNAIAFEFNRHSALVENALNDSELKKYKFLSSASALFPGDVEWWNTSLRFLCDCLYKATDKRTIILIDEYDVPLENAYFCGFYNELIGFLRSLFESSLKTNPCLEFAVITGFLRVSRESLFTGMNNLRMVTVLHNTFGEYFGFTQAEVDDILEYYKLQKRRGDMRDWYNGYTIGGADVYNPWSVVCTLDYLRGNANDTMKPHWVNTSSNEIVRILVNNADENARYEIESLIEGDTIEKPVREDLTYDQMLESGDNLWNFMYFTGYLTRAGDTRLVEEQNMLPMRIPNIEVRYVYKNVIRTWFEKQLESRELEPLYRAILDGDAPAAANMLKIELLDTISFYDYKESFYHGFLAGLLRKLKGYVAKSNRESGDGRPNIVLFPRSMTNVVVIIEIKVAKTLSELDGACEEALRQIEERRYEAGPRSEGYSKFMHYGVAFYKKEAAARCHRFD